jgi:hypothetical protein
MVPNCKTSQEDYMTPNLYKIGAMLVLTVLSTNRPLAQKNNTRVFWELSQYTGKPADYDNIQLAVAGTDLAPRIYWSSNREDFYPLETVKCECEKEGQSTIHVTDPLNREQGNFEMFLVKRGGHGSYITIGDKRYDNVTTRRKPKLHSAPKTQFPASILRTADGRSILSAKTD